MQYDPNRNQQGWNAQGYAGNQQPAGANQPYAAYQQNAYRQGQQTGGQAPQQPGQTSQPNPAYPPYGQQQPVYGGYGYQQPQQGGYPPQGYPQPGGYPGANPYGQGYGQPNGYQGYPGQGYNNGYAQSPYAQPGGYPNSPYAQPYQQAQANQQPQRGTDSHSLLKGPILYGCLGFVLLALFALAMVFPASPLRWLFTVLAVAAIAGLWLMKSPLGRGTRVTVSVILAALAVVAVASGLAQPGRDRQQPSTPNAGVPAAQVQATEETPVVLENTPEPQAQPAAANNADPLNSEAAEQVKNFYYFWSVNNYDNMVTLCPPSWVRSQESASVSIFQLVGNRHPVDFTVTAITGTENDTSRTVSVEATIDRHLSNNSIQKYLQKIVVLKEDGVWYVDPRSLESHEATPSPSPENALPTQPPPPPDTADPATKLYYNPNGGERYHVDAYCKSANQKFLPFKGVFTYAELNNEPYTKLEPCPICSAPLRPGT